MDLKFVNNFTCITTPFRISNAQSASPSSLKSAHEVGVLNEKRCK